jgi:outer membrane protein assembly factor BamE (lipoprotein component of BamABCDE complex)
MHKRLFLFAGLVMLCGCLATHNSQTTRHGTQIASETFDRIKAGTTTAGWIEATLGPPTSKSKDGSNDIWKYIYTEHTDSSGAIFLIFGGSDSTEKSETTFIEFNNGVVTSKWRG